MAQCVSNSLTSFREIDVFFFLLTLGQFFFAGDSERDSLSERRRTMFHIFSFGRIQLPFPLPFGPGAKFNDVAMAERASEQEGFLLQTRQSEKEIQFT